MDPDCSSEYTWQPLPNPSRDIRLLTLYPGSRDDDVQYSLEVVPLFKAPAYQALSYTWGDPSKRVPIYVHDEAFPAKPRCSTQVTSNLASALRDLRSITSELTLWIDALCINQSDPIERTHQVNAMGMIFRKASMVWIWPGPSSSNIDLAVKLFTRMSSSPNHTITKTMPGPFNEDEWAALAEFFKQSWWSRIWVVQEVMYARDAQLICGRHRIPWTHIKKPPETDHFSHLCVDFQELDRYKRRYEEDPNRDGPEKIWKKGPRARDKMWRQSLQTLLWVFRYRQASDSRDKIYALLDLAKQPTPLQPDYNKSTTEVYCELAKWFMSNPGNKNPLDYLAITHNIRSPRIKDLPSWAPDWSAWEDTVSLGIVSHLQSTPSPFGQSQYSHLERLRGPFHANDDITRNGFWEYSEPMRNFIKNRVGGQPAATEPLQELTIRGVFIGTLATLGANLDTADSSASLQRTVFNVSAPQSETPMTEWQTTLTQWHSLIASHPSTYPLTGEPTTSALLSTFLASPVTPSLRNQFLAWTRSPSSSPPIPLPHGFRFAITLEGGFALVPNLAQENDKIIVPFGSSTPFVLRPQDENRYELIGRCYVHGIMNGEALEPIHTRFETSMKVEKEAGIEAAKKFIHEGIGVFTLI